jgi:alkaline phosphatase D
MKPIITTWDDHEIADNAYNEGAENHQDNEGSYITRKNAATQAYYEWLPIQPKLNEPLYRSFSIGSLIKLIVLDTRIVERTAQVDSAEIINYYDSTRTILGKKQFKWLTQNLEQKETWKIICNQVPVGPMYSPTIIKDNIYMDGWDGYPFEKEKFLHFLEDNKINNTVIVTGDYHRSIAMETDLKGTLTSDDNVAVEFIVTSITSANDDEYYSLEKAQKRKELYLINNPNMKYCNNIDNGYLTLKITRKEVIAEYLNLSTVKKSDSIQHLDQRFKVKNGKNVLVK